MATKSSPGAASVADFDSFKKMISAKNVPDFQISIGGYEWAVHSRVLSSKSMFFDRICNGPFKESNERDIRLHDDCPWTVAHMILWCYLDEKSNWDLAINPRGDATFKSMVIRPDCADFLDARYRYGDYSDWQRYAKLYLVADKYATPDLMTMAREKLRRYLKNASTPSMRTVVKYIEPTIVANHPDLLELMLETAYWQSEDSQMFYKVIKAAFEEEPTAVEAALDFLFARSPRKENVAKLARSVEKAGEMYTDLQQRVVAAMQESCLTNEIPTERIRQLEDQLAQVQLDIARLAIK